MKKKIINGFLMLTLLVSTMGSFVSCKDYDEDVYVDLRGKITDQTKLIDALQTQVDELQATVKDLKTCTCEVKGYLTKAEADGLYAKIGDYATTTQLAAAETAIKLLDGKINDVETLLASLNNTTTNIVNDITNVNTEITSVKSTIIEVKNLLDKTNIDLSALEKRVDGLDALIAGWSDQMKAVTQKAQDALTQANSNKELIENLQKKIDELNKKIDAQGSANVWTIVDGYWYCNGENSGVKAVGIDGQDGKNGDTWYIGPDGYWYKNEGEWTGVKAEGKDGSMGPRGPKGDKGDKGDPGTGSGSNDGYTTVTTNADGTVTLTQYDASGNVVATATVNIKGTPGTPGTPGKNGTSWQINPTTKNWEYKNDGDTEWHDTGICAEGQSGTGMTTNYSLVTMNSEDGKWHVITYDKDGNPVSDDILDFAACTCGFNPTKFSDLETKVNNFYTNYIDNGKLQDAIDKINNLVKENNQEIKNIINNYLTENKYTTETQVQNITNNILKDYYTKTEVTNLLNNYVTNEYLTNNYYTKTEILNLLNENKTSAKNDISSLLVQATECPAFGYFNFPLDIRSNMLLVFYGNQSRFFFPSSETFTAEELANMGLSSVSAVPGRVKHNGGKFIKGSDTGDFTGNAGNIYLTVNPANADLTGKTFTLVNSQGKESGVKLETPVASNKTLTFGYSHTRAGSDLGFYQVRATLEPENITGSTLLSIDPDALIEDAKSAFKSKSASGILSVAASFAQSLNNKVEANAVKAAWTDPNLGDRVVTSDFSIAATAIEPLTIDLVHTVLDGRTLPGMGRIQNLIDEIIHKIKVEFPVPGFDIQDYIDKYVEKLDRDKIFKNFEILDNKQIRITLPSITVGGSTQDVTIVINLSDDGYETLYDLESIVVYSDNGSRGKADIQDAINEIISDLLKLNSLESKWNKSILDAEDNMTDQLNEYVVKVYKKLNRLFAKGLNAFDLLLIGRQPSTGTLAMLSQSKTMPTKASGTITLWPTTYSLEFFAPAYKKILAVTNAFDAAGNSVPAKAIAANQGENMAQVIDGDKRAALTGEAGYTYEITYAVVDYHAKEHKVKYYVKF